MSDWKDHERIYLEPPSDESDMRETGRCWCPDRIDSDWTEYVRADVAIALRTQLADREAELERVREALDAIISESPHRKPAQRPTVGFSGYFQKVSAENADDAIEQAFNEGGDSRAWNIAQIAHAALSDKGGATPTEPQWSGWIKWEGGECPIPWAEDGDWGYIVDPRHYFSIADQPAMWMIEAWRHTPEFVSITAYRYRLDRAPAGFTPDKGGE